MSKRILPIIALLTAVVLCSGYTIITGTDTQYGQEVLTTNKTINFDNSMSSADMQALIDAAPHSGFGMPTLSFQFADGTYSSIASGLVFDGFDSSINVSIQGNTGDGAYNPGTTDPSVLLSFAAGVTSNAIRIVDCSAYVTLRYLEVDAPGVTGYADYIAIERCKYVYTYRVVADAPAGDAYCISYDGSRGSVRDCWVSLGNYGIYATNASHIIVQNCDDFGTAPQWGIAADAGSIIGKHETTANLPDGTTADYKSANGGIYVQEGTIDY